MSLAIIQPAGGMTFNPETVAATADTTMTVGEVVHITDSGLINVAPTDTEVVVTKQAAATLKHGFYGVVTKEITATKGGTIALTGIHEADCAASPDTNWTAGMALTVDGNGELTAALDTNVIVAYALEACDVSADGSAKVFMAGGPAMATCSI